MGVDAAINEGTCTHQRAAGGGDIFGIFIACARPDDPEFVVRFHADAAEPAALMS